MRRIARRWQRATPRGCRKAGACPAHRRARAGSPSLLWPRPAGTRRARRAAPGLRNWRRGLPSRYKPRPATRRRRDGRPHRHACPDRRRKRCRAGRIELVGAEQIDEIDFAFRCAVENAGHVAASSGTKPRSSAATREAAVCSTLNPFQPPSAALPAGPIMPVSPAMLRRKLQDRRAIGARESRRGPRSASAAWRLSEPSRKSWLPSAMSGNARDALRPAAATG